MVGRNADNIGFGNLVSLKPANTSYSTTTNKVPKFTRTIKVSQHVFMLLKGHARRHDIDTFETVILNLLKYYDEHSKDWYHKNTS